MSSRLKIFQFQSRIRAVFGGKSSRGLTLVELLVAMAVSLLVILAAAAALLAGRRGAGTVDVAGQLRDNGRFASETIQRLVVQTGFEDMQYAVLPYAGTEVAYTTQSGTNIASLRPNLQGYNNAIPSSTDPLNNAQAHPAGAGAGSDVLILQYQTVKGILSAQNGSVNSADGSMIDCAGHAPTESSIKRDDRMVSILYVSTDSTGEPSLMCMSKNTTTGAFSTTPLIRGVESFQVLYGVDNVDANSVPGSNASTVNVSTVPNKYLRADQLTVAGNETATYTNWRRVRSLRIGLVLRGPEGSGQEVSNQTHYPLGSSAYSGAADAGSILQVNDDRLRQVVTFTVLLRNCQNQGYQPAPSDPNNPIPCNVVMPS